MVFNKSSNTHHARSCGFIRQPIRFKLPVPGGHAGRSRAHVELVRCANPNQTKPCGRHVRARMSKSSQTLCFRSGRNIKTHSDQWSFNRKLYIRIALLRIKAKNNTSDAGGHAGVGSPSHGTDMAPRGHEKVRLRRLSRSCYNHGRLFSAPPWARWSAGRNNI